VFHERELAEECRKYNPIAQKELYDRYAELIMAICYRYTRDMWVAEDLMQDSLIKVLTRIKTFKWKNDGSFKAWIKKIAVNTCLTYLENSKKYRNFEIDVDKTKQMGEDSENIHDTEEADENSTNESEMELINRAEFTKEEMFEALAKVPDPYRIIFNLHVIEGYKHKEISEMLQINVKTSKTRLFRARKVLKELLHTMSIKKVQTVRQ
jgi:RNA polymerase sigma-70 factor (ECF subfamily)